MPEIEHPNRDTASSKATKAGVIGLLVVSAGLIALVTAGGWSELQGAQPVAFGYILLYLVMSFYVSRWNRGVLPVAAALAALFAVIAAVAGPAWLDRSKDGFHDPALDPVVLGLLTLVLVPVQILLLALSMRAFSQKWNVEIEVRRGDSRPPEGRPPPGARAGESPAT